MTGIRCLACLWVLFVTQTGLCSDIQFLERHEGDSVVLPCVVEPSDPAPIGVYLNRAWLHPSKVLFKYTKSNFTLGNDEDKERTSVSGDPSTRSLNVTISQLRAGDTDHYHCVFVVKSPSYEDIRLPGKTEFFLLVRPDASGSMDIGLVETCAGGSATLPCLPTNGEGLAVAGVSLTRRRGRAPWEVLYHSKHHHSSGASSSSSSSSSSSQFPVERVHPSFALGPGGITYNLTLRQLQLEDSGLYSCQLLLRGKSDSSRVGTKVFFLSVQGSTNVTIIDSSRYNGTWCGCSKYPALLYALSSAMAVFLLLLGVMLVYQSKSRRSVNSHAPAPIYEEMSGVQTSARKLAPLIPAEPASSEHGNRPVMKPCPENHYESPSGALFPRRASRK